MRDNITISSIEKLFPSGALLVCGFLGTNMVRRQYMGYSKREALAMFKRDVKEARP